MAVGSGTPLSILFQILGVEEAKAKLASISPEMAKIQQSAKGATTDSNAMGTSLTKVGASSTGINQAATNVQKLDTTEKAASTSANTLATNHAKLDTTVKSTGTSANTVSSSLQTMDKSQQTASTSATTLSTAHGKVQTSSTGVATASGTVKTSMDAQSTSMEKGAISTQKVSEGHTSLKAAFTATAGSTTALVSSTVSLWESYDSLQDAQLRVDKASNTLQATRIKEQSLQNQLNALIANGVTEGDKYTLVQDKLSLAHEKVTAAEGTLQNAQEDLNVTQIEFYKTIIPQVITVLGSAASVIGNMGPLLGAMKTGIGGVSSALSSISLTNPFFIAITVGAAVVTAFTTNLFGFRDAVNGVGVALGNLVPFMKPFLTILGDLGQGLVNFLGQGGQQAKAFGQDVSTGFETGATGAKTGAQQITTHLSSLKAPISNTDAIIAGFTNDSSANWKSAGEATKALPQGLQGSLTASEKYMQALVGDAESTVAKMQEVFSKSIKVGNLDVTGFNASIQGANISVDTLDKAFSRLGPHVLEVTSTIEGYTKVQSSLSQVHTIVNASTGKLIVNLDELQAVFKKTGVSLAEQSSIIDTLSTKMGVQFVSAVDADINGTNNLAKSTTNAKEQLALQMKQQQANIDVSGQHSTANQNLAGTTAGVNAAFGQMTNTLDDTNAAAQESTGIFGNLVKQQTELDKATGENNATLTTAEGLLRLYNIGMDEAKKKEQEATIEVIKNALAVSQQAEFLGTSYGQFVSYTQGLVTTQEELNKTTASVKQNEASIALLNAQLATGKPQQDAFLAGLTSQQLELVKAALETENARGKNKALADQLTDTTLITAKFTEGQTTAEKAMLDMAANASKTAGEVSILAANLRTGEEQTAQFASGFADAVKKEFEMVSQTANLKGEVQSLAISVKGAGAGIIEYNKGLEEGRVAALEHAKAVDEARGTYIGTRTVLFDLAKGYGAAGVAANASNDQIQQFDDVMRQSPDAIQKVIDALGKFAESAASKIADAMGKGKDAVQEAITSIQQELGRALSAPEIRTLQVEANTTKAVTRIQDDLSLAFAGAGQAAKDSVQKSIADAMKVAQAEIQVSGGRVKEAWQTILTSLGQINADPLNAQTFVQSASKITLALSTIGISGQNAIDFLTKIGLSSGQATQLVNQFGQGAQAAGQATQEANPALQEFYRTVAGFGALESVAQQVFGTGIPAAIKSAAPSMTAAFNTYAQAGIATFTQALLLLGPATTQAVGQVNTAFAGINPLQPSYTAGLTAMESSLNILISEVNRTVTQTNTEFTALNPVSSTFVSGMTSIETSLNLLVSETGTAVAGVNTAFTQMGVNLPQVLSGIESTVLNEMNAIVNIVNGVIPVKIPPIFTAMVNAVIPTFAPLATEANTAFQGIVNIANAIIPVLIPSVFTNMSNQITPIYTKMSTDANTAFQNIVSVANAVIPVSIPAVFTNMTNLIAPIYTKMSTDANTGMQSIVNITNAVIPVSIPPIFIKMADEVATTWTRMVSDANTGMQQIVNTVNSIIPLKIPSIFTDMSNNIVNVYTKLKTDAITGFDAIVTEATNIIPAKIPPVFTNMSNEVVKVYTKLKTDATTGFDAIVFEANHSIFTKIPATFTNMSNEIVKVYTKIKSDAVTGFDEVINAVNSIIPLKIPSIFTEMATNIVGVYGRIKTDAENGFNNIVNAAATIIPTKIPPIFTTMSISVAGAYNRMQSDAANGFNGIVNIAGVTAPKTVTPFVKSVADIVAQVGTLPAKTKPEFEQIANNASAAANRVSGPFVTAFNSVISAASSMSSRVSGSFLNIASSAQTAINSVRSLQASINSLQGKVITITTIYRTVYQTVYAAKGFGPAIVDTPTHLVVGEAGPEAVMVTPLKSGVSARNGSNIPGNTVFAAGGFYDDDSDYEIDDEGNVYGGGERRRTHKSFSKKHRRRFPKPPPFIQDTYDGDTSPISIMPPTSYQNAEAYPGGGSIAQNTITVANKIYTRLDSFTNGVSQILGKASGLLTGATRTNTPGILSPGGGTTYADYGTTSGLITGHNGFIKLPDTMTQPTPLRSRSNISLPIATNTGGSKDITSFTSQMGDMIGKIAIRVLDSAANKMSLTINNQNIIDGKKIYDNQQRHFGLKNGTLLK
jgi:hypothetical protein